MSTIIREANQLSLKNFENPDEELAYWFAQQREKAYQAEKEIYNDKIAQKDEIILMKDEELVIKD
ncbi:MAG: hypothetical protein LBM96_00160 [Methanobrevibacter sp.]|jgi:hypothetical protein|nr:hypothetical protein [Candidatus Methanoflexus mossambicus]